MEFSWFYNIVESYSLLKSKIGKPLNGFNFLTIFLINNTALIRLNVLISVQFSDLQFYFLHLKNTITYMSY